MSSYAGLRSLSLPPRSRTELANGETESRLVNEPLETQITIAPALSLPTGGKTHLMAYAPSASAHVPLEAPPEYAPLGEPPAYHEIEQLPAYSAAPHSDEWTIGVGKEDKDDLGFASSLKPLEKGIANVISPLGSGPFPPQHLMVGMVLTSGNTSGQSSGAQSDTETQSLLGLITPYLTTTGGQEALRRQGEYGIHGTQSEDGQWTASGRCDCPSFRRRLRTTDATNPTDGRQTGRAAIPAEAQSARPAEQRTGLRAESFGESRQYRRGCRADGYRCGRHNAVDGQ